MPAVPSDQLHAALDRLAQARQGLAPTSPVVDTVDAATVAQLHADLSGEQLDLAWVEAALRAPPAEAMAEEAREPLPQPLSITVRVRRAQAMALGVTGLTATYLVGGTFFIHQLMGLYPLHLAACVGLGAASGKLLRRWLDLKAEQDVPFPDP